MLVVILKTVIVGVFRCLWFQLCLVLLISVKRLVEKAECFTPVDRLAE